MSASDRCDADRAINCHLLRLACQLGSDTVLGYLAMPDEVRIDGFLAGAVERGMDVLLPWSKGGEIVFRRWRPVGRIGRDEKGVWGPVGFDLDGGGNGVGLMVVPGRAFDQVGTRLGRGGGYYDRLLSRPAGAARTVVGVAYGCQTFSAIPHEAHDVPVDVVVTETGAHPIARS